MIERTKRLAVIRVRGQNNVRRNIKETISLMNLKKLHNLTFIDDRKSYLGMLKRGKDWITWGEPELEAISHVLKRWGRLPGKKMLTDDYVEEQTKGKFKSIEEFAKAFIELKAEIKDIPGLKPFFRLHPPRKGYDRAGIKKPYTLGGALGYRGENINDLIKRMS
ncbi:MAG: 50S ribosomal protein L30 [Candidatus Hodarchaeales archaeon]|jgi:large subunit ribosomal protein L30